MRNIPELISRLRDYQECHDGDVDEAADALEEMYNEREYESCMSLYVDEYGKSVELLLDTSITTYAEWIPGEGGDISLIRCQETKKVVGVYLPLLRTNLCVGHTGPMCINTGFEKKK